MEVPNQGTLSHTHYKNVELVLIAMKTHQNFKEGSKVIKRYKDHDDCCMANRLCGGKDEAGIAAHWRSLARL